LQLEPQEEAKLVAAARARGVSLDVLHCLSSRPQIDIDMQ
jgi:hypothetical protein